MEHSPRLLPPGAPVESRAPRARARRSIAPQSHCYAEEGCADPRGSTRFWANVLILRSTTARGRHVASQVTRDNSRAPGDGRGQGRTSALAGQRAAQHAAEDQALPPSPPRARTPVGCSPAPPNAQLGEVWGRSATRVIRGWRTTATPGWSDCSPTSSPPPGCVRWLNLREVDAASVTLVAVAAILQLHPTEIVLDSEPGWSSDADPARGAVDNLVGNAGAASRCASRSAPSRDDRVNRRDRRRAAAYRTAAALRPFATGTLAGAAPAWGLHRAPARPLARRRRRPARPDRARRPAASSWCPPLRPRPLELPTCRSASSWWTTSSSTPAGPDLPAVPGRLRGRGRAADGAEAVRLAEQLRPDVVVLDLGLPDIAGRRCSRCAPTRRSPKVVVFSGLGPPDRILTRDHSGVRPGTRTSATRGPAGVGRAGAGHRGRDRPPNELSSVSEARRFVEGPPREWGIGARWTTRCWWSASSPRTLTTRESSYAGSVCRPPRWRCASRSTTRARGRPSHSR